MSRWRPDASREGSPSFRQPVFGRDLVQEEVELRDLAGASRDDAIRRHHADDHRAAKHAAHVVVHEPVVEQITHHGGDAGDRERVAHARRPCRLARCSSSDFGLRRAGSRRGGGASCTAVTSIRPMVTCTSVVSSIAGRAAPAGCGTAAAIASGGSGGPSLRGRSGGGASGVDRRGASARSSGASGRRPDFAARRSCGCGRRGCVGRLAWRDARFGRVGRQWPRERFRRNRYIALGRCGRRRAPRRRLHRGLEADGVGLRADRCVARRWPRRGHVLDAALRHERRRLRGRAQPRFR